MRSNKPITSGSKTAAPRSHAGRCAVQGHSQGPPGFAPVYLAGATPPSLLQRPHLVDHAVLCCAASHTGAVPAQQHNIYTQSPPPPPPLPLPGRRRRRCGGVSSGSGRVARRGGGSGATHAPDCGRRGSPPHEAAAISRCPRRCLTAAAAAAAASVGARREGV
jgi:hypothetical protein